MDKFDRISAWPYTSGFKPPENPLNLYISANAFFKARSLVVQFDTEVDWSMTVKPYKDGYLVEDVLVGPQEVSPAYVHVDLGAWSLWKARLRPEEDEYLFGHGHSHVRMPVDASAIDIDRHIGEITQKGAGYYLYQIWNKSGDINSYFYDIDHKIYYSPKNIRVDLNFGDQDRMEFIADAKRMTVTTNESKWGCMNEFE